MAAAAGAASVARAALGAGGRERRLRAAAGVAACGAGACGARGRRGWGRGGWGRGGCGCHARCSVAASATALQTCGLATQRAQRARGDTEMPRARAGPECGPLLRRLASDMAASPGGTPSGARLVPRRVWRSPCSPSCSLRPRGPSCSRPAHCPPQRQHAHCCPPNSAVRPPPHNSATPPPRGGRTARSQRPHNLVSSRIYNCRRRRDQNNNMQHDSSRRTTL